jgi:anti-sigma B factor antagonist
MEATKPVIVRRAPESLNLKQARAFMEEIRPLLGRDRPQIVFDLSQLRKIDSAGIEMLVQCMHEAVRRDGDLKLAALSPQAQMMLELTRTARLFEVFATPAEAVRSFSGYQPNMVRQFHRRAEAERAPARKVA